MIYIDASMNPNTSRLPSIRRRSPDFPLNLTSKILLVSLQVISKDYRNLFQRSVRRLRPKKEKEKRKNKREREKKDEKTAAARQNIQTR